MDGNGRVLACCEVHHTEQESQLRVFSDALRGGSGVQGSKSVVQGGDRSSRGKQLLASYNYLAYTPNSGRSRISKRGGSKVVRCTHSAPDI